MKSNFYTLNSDKLRFLPTPKYDSFLLYMVIKKEKQIRKINNRDRIINELINE